MRPAAARRYLDDHLAGEADYGEILWLTLSLELWAGAISTRTAAAAPFSPAAASVA